MACGMSRSVPTRPVPAVPALRKQEMASVIVEVMYNSEEIIVEQGVSGLKLPSLSEGSVVHSVFEKLASPSSAAELNSIFFRPHRLPSTWRGVFLCAYLLGISQACFLTGRCVSKHALFLMLPRP